MGQKRLFAGDGVEGAVLNIMTKNELGNYIFLYEFRDCVHFRLSPALVIMRYRSIMKNEIHWSLWRASWRRCIYRQRGDNGHRFFNEITTPCKLVSGKLLYSIIAVTTFLANSTSCIPLIIKSSCFSKLIESLRFLFSSAQKSMVNAFDLVQREVNLFTCTRYIENAILLYKWFSRVIPARPCIDINSENREHKAKQTFNSIYYIAAQKSAQKPRRALHSRKSNNFASMRIYYTFCSRVTQRITRRTPDSERIRLFSLLSQFH